MVGDLRGRSRRRVFRSTLGTGLVDDDGALLTPFPDLLAPLDLGPLDPRTGVDAAAALDHALRVELLVRGLAVAHESSGAHDGPHAAAVLIRSGPMQLVDDDLAWWRATRVAAGVLDLPLRGLYVVTRPGWVDVGHGVAVRLPRQRDRRRAYADNASGGR